MKNLVEYSSSDSDSEEDDCSVVPAKKMKKEDQVVQPKRSVKLPMLLSVEKPQAKGSREDHQMRTRAIPHVEGNWATHVFIDCKFYLFQRSSQSKFTPPQVINSTKT